MKTKRKILYSTTVTAIYRRTLPTWKGPGSILAASAENSWWVSRNERTQKGRYDLWLPLWASSRPQKSFLNSSHISVLPKTSSFSKMALLEQVNRRLCNQTYYMNFKLHTYMLNRIHMKLISHDSIYWSFACIFFKWMNEETLC